MFSSVPVDVIVDLTGTFAPGGALAFTPAAPDAGVRHPQRDRRMVAGARDRPDDRHAGGTRHRGRGDRHRDDGRPPGAGFATVFGCGARAADLERERRRRARCSPTRSRSGLGLGGTAVHLHLDDVARVVRRVGVVGPVTSQYRCHSSSGRRSCRVLLTRRAGVRSGDERARDDAGAVTADDPELFFNPLQPGYVEDPWPHFAEMRAHDPVHLTADEPVAAVHLRGRVAPAAAIRRSA